MKPLLAALAFLAATPAAAEPLPQGNFVLGTYIIWPDAAQARYAVLSIEGSDMALSFYSPMPLDDKACKYDGNCFYFTEGATAQASLDTGKIALTNIEIDPDAPINPGMKAHAGITDEFAYTVPLTGMIQGAILAQTPDGFTLATGVNELEFYRAEGEAWKLAAVIPLIYGKSIVRMKACEVRTILPLIAKAEPSPSEKRFINALYGLMILEALRNEARAIAPYWRNNSEEDKTRALHLNTLANIPNMIAGWSLSEQRKRTDSFQTVWSIIGENLYGNDRAAFDAGIAKYGDTLPDVVAFLRHLNTFAKQQQLPSIEAICADPSLGFIE